VVMYDRLARGRTTAGGLHHPVPGGMIETAENLRREYGISRAAQDEYALRSHQRAVEAQQKGLFDDEIVAVTVPGRRGDTVVDTDEHPRADTTLESLASLPAVMRRQDPDSTVTAGNATTISATLGTGVLIPSATEVSAGGNCATGRPAEAAIIVAAHTLVGRSPPKIGDCGTPPTTVPSGATVRRLPGRRRPAPPNPGPARSVGPRR